MRETGKYIGIFISLLLLTALTVALSYIKKAFWAAVTAGLLIAFIKSSLVGEYFMHLIREKPAVFWLLLLTFVLLVSVLVLPLVDVINQVRSHARPF